MSGDPGSTTRHVVVVLSFHGKDDTIRCVASLREHAPHCRVVVVDNGSFDGVLDAVAQRWPDVLTHQTGDNLGFSGGMNVGVREAVAAGADVVTILNNDTVVEAGALQETERLALGGAAVSPVVRYLRDGAIWFGGGVVDVETGLPRHLAEHELPPHDRSSEPYEVDLLAGCCVTAQVSTWARVGGFDERFFLMFEDSDWSLRASRLGVRLIVVPRAVVLHEVSASFGGRYRYLGLYYYARNGLLFVRERVGGNVAVRGRFLRRHALRPVVEQARRRDVRETGRLSLALGLAVADDARRRYGRSPGWIESRSATWAGVGSSGRASVVLRRRPRHGVTLTDGPDDGRSDGETV